MNLAGPWTQTSAGTPEHLERWGQLKRTFNVPAALRAKRQAAIRQRADEIYRKRAKDGPVNTALGDWLQAEAELNQSA